MFNEIICYKLKAYLKIKIVFIYFLDTMDVSVEPKDTLFEVRLYKFR